MNIKVWFGRGKKNTLAELKQVFDTCVEHGITGVNFQFNPDNMDTILSYSDKLELQIWKILLCNNNTDIIKAHPDWYMVNRNGVSTLEAAPYVGYYRWLCPSKLAVQEYLLDEVEKLCQYPEISGIHLDYVRYPDVILPLAIQPDYNLQQLSEQPEFDFCYCDNCRKTFLEQTGKDPLQMENPQNDPEWLKFRYDNVSNLVIKLRDKIHTYGKKATAAVFPSPLLARTLVRQDWQSWDLDEYYPMIYHNFYLKEWDWITQISKFNREIIGDKAKLFSGIFMPNIEPKADLFSKIIDSGAEGIALFDYNTITDEHWKFIKAIQLK